MKNSYYFHSMIFAKIHTYEKNIRISYYDFFKISYVWTNHTHFILWFIPTYFLAGHRETSAKVVYSVLRESEETGDETKVTEEKWAKRGGRRCKKFLWKMTRSLRGGKKRWTAGARRKHVSTFIYETTAVRYSDRLGKSHRRFKAKTVRFKESFIKNVWHLFILPSVLATHIVSLLLNCA